MENRNSNEFCNNDMELNEPCDTQSEVNSNQELIIMANKAMEYAYAPYSGFKVGAAVCTDSGKIFTGCNIENASFGATNCAERTAVFKAVSEGHRRINKIAIVSSNNRQTFPCGICRQVLIEFMEEDGRIILCDKDITYEYKLKDMLPFGFGKEELL